MIEFKEIGVTFLGGGEVIVDDLHTSVKLAPNLIAADGAADFAVENGFLPKAAIGDMDSISKDFFTYNSKVLKIHEKEQETTDFDKCLKNIKAKFGIGIGFLGAQIDHELAALNSIVIHDKYPIFLIGKRDVIFNCPSFLNLILPAGTRVSLFPMCKVRVSTEGLAWPLHNELLSPLERIGTSNVSNCSRVKIETHSKGLLIILPKLFLSDVIDSVIS